MHIAQDTIQDSVSTIWSSMLGLEAQPCPSRPHSATPPVFLTGCVQITGAWQGAVILDCPLELAKRAAAIMFDMPLDDINSLEIHDALGELTNIVGGNFKSLLPESCSLSLPAVTQGTDYAFRVLDSEVINRVGFQCENHPFVVTILKQCSR
jgi:CheY-specific phosphatase CheX